MGSDTLILLYLRGGWSVHCLSAACWKQNILLLFGGFPSSDKVLLNFQNLRLASSSEPPDTDIFPVLLPHVCFLICSSTTSFASSVITFLNLNLKIYSPFLHLSEKEPFLIAHFPLLPQFTLFVLTQPVFNVSIMYKPFSHCPYETYVTSNFSCLLHFSLASFPQDTL